MMFVKSIIEERLSTDVLSISKLSGGDINQVFKITCLQGTYVVKYNSLLKFPGMFSKEANGLRMLQKGGIKTPSVIDHFEQMDDQFLVLEYVEQENYEVNFWVNFANDLAVLHQKSHVSFGLDEQNFIGSLPQLNEQKSNWEEFFVLNRLKPLVKMAFDQKLLTKNHLDDFDSFYLVLPELLPTEPPSLLHGDLWSGNLLCGAEQQAVFIDPAVYYGHREVDIAMTRMFGGFDPVYLDHYHERFPLEKGWEERIPIHNLYPNLVHLILFGKSYLSGIERVVQKYS